MGRAVQADEKVIETWEATTESTTWVWTYDRRDDKYVKVRVGGKGGASRRLHISRDDRRFNQEQVVDEMKLHDPFVNGALRLVSTEKADDIDATYHLTEEDLVAMLSVRDQVLFEVTVEDIKSELLLRRLKDVAETHATVAQLEFINELIVERYKVGGTQRTVAEMMASGETLGTVLS